MSQLGYYLKTHCSSVITCTHKTALLLHVSQLCDYRYTQNSFVITTHVSALWIPGHTEQLCYYYTCLSSVITCTHVSPLLLIFYKEGNVYPLNKVHSASDRQYLFFFPQFCSGIPAIGCCRGNLVPHCVRLPPVLLLQFFQLCLQSTDHRFILGLHHIKSSARTLIN